MARDPARGSALVLFPAGLLVAVVLASLAVDRVVVVRAQRSLVATAQAAANDAAGAGIDADALRSSGRTTYDRSRIDAAVRAAVADAPPGTQVRWHLAGDVVTVHLEHDVQLVFAPALGGGHQRVVATASAQMLFQ